MALCFLSPDNEQLARSGSNCLENLAVSVGKQFFPDTWDKVCKCARDIFTNSIPHQLLTWKPDDNQLGRSYSTLSIASTRSSLASEIPEDMLPPPSPSPTNEITNEESMTSSPANQNADVEGNAQEPTGEALEGGSEGIQQTASKPPALNEPQAAISVTPAINIQSEDVNEDTVSSLTNQISGSDVRDAAPQVANQIAVEQGEQAAEEFGDFQSVQDEHSATQDAPPTSTGNNLVRDPPIIGSGESQVTSEDVDGQGGVSQDTNTSVTINTDGEGRQQTEMVGAEEVEERGLEQNQPGTFSSSALPGIAVRVKVEGEGEEGEEVDKGTDGKPEVVLPQVAGGSLQRRESERSTKSDRLAGSKSEDKKRGKGGERKSKLLKKLGRKEKGKKGRKAEEKVADDAQSEFSYGQPDTDLSRSKASKRAFSESRTFTFISFTVLVVLPFSIPPPHSHSTFPFLPPPIHPPIHTLHSIFPFHIPIHIPIPYSHSRTFTVPFHSLHHCFRCSSILHTSLVPRPLPRKAERGSGVLSNISCHMGRDRTA